ncbi:MAG: FeoB-associated Cys-rich membrane protein [Lachnospiraceae bacterium]|nr:FeoB-associated Cys-rich membrane protein [Lachnospiraceae bacterium]
MGTVIVFLAVLLIVGLCIWDIVRSHKKESSCGGCEGGSCTGCSGCGDGEILVTVKRRKEKSE